MSDNENIRTQTVSTLPRDEAPARADAGRALATAKAHFVARGWRPLAIEPPALRERCGDVVVSLLLNDTGETLWLSARDWSALPHPQDAFRREMACVRAARVDRTILVYDGDFPDGVVEAAAHAPQLRLIDAAILREMAVSDALPGASAVAASRDSASRASAPAVPAPAVRAAGRAQRFAQPARRAARYLAQVVDARPVAAAERYFHETFARRLRQVDGERRRLKTLGTAALVAIGASIGFFAFNLVWLKRAPEGGDSASIRVAQADPKPLPQPMPPPQGYVAQAAGASSSMLRAAYASSDAAFRHGSMASLSSRSLPASMISTGIDGVAQRDDRGAYPMPNAMDSGHPDIEETQRRADEAMRVLAPSTPEVRSVLSPAMDAPLDSASLDSVPPDSASTNGMHGVSMDGTAMLEDPARVD